MKLFWMKITTTVNWCATIDFPTSFQSISSIYSIVTGTLYPDRPTTGTVSYANVATQAGTIDSYNTSKIVFSHGLNKTTHKKFIIMIGI